MVLGIIGLAGSVIMLLPAINLVGATALYDEFSFLWE